MTNKEKYKKAFDVLASSEQISLEVENMANKKRKKSFMAITVAAVIVFGTLTVGAAAYYNWSNGLSEELRIDEEKQCWKILVWLLFQKYPAQMPG